MTDPCPICEDIRVDTTAKKISHGRATKTAHALAIHKADEGIPGLEWTEVYGLFFPKIYKHELERNLKLERELVSEASVEKHKDHPDVCGYHSENVGWAEDGSHEKCMKSLRRWYGESKWPNSLERKYYGEYD